MKRSDAELMQYRMPVGAGPSSKRWPRCESPAFERTSIRVMPWLRSTLSMTLSRTTGRVKLGHPVPESNLSRDENSGSPVATSTYKPASWLSQNSLWNGGSVASRWVTSYCMAVRRFFSSSSDGLR
jgi:hypothetical protein